MIFFTQTAMAGSSNCILFGLMPASDTAPRPELTAWQQTTLLAVADEDYDDDFEDEDDSMFDEEYGVDEDDLDDSKFKDEDFDVNFDDDFDDDEDEFSNVDDDDDDDFNDW